MRVVIGCFFYLVCNMVFSATTVMPSLNKPEAAFDIKEANKQFDHLNIQLSVQNVNIDNLNAAVSLLTNLKAKADDCIITNQKRVSTIDTQIQQANLLNEAPKTISTDSHITPESSKSPADLIYLNSERKKWGGQLAQCRLFTIRAKEALDAYGTVIAQLKQEETLTRGLPLWSILNKLATTANEQTFDWSLNIKLPVQMMSTLFWTIIIAASFFLSSIILFKVYRSSRVRHYIRIRAFHITHFILLTLCLMCALTAAYLQFVSTQLGINVDVFLTQITTGLFLYLFGLLIALLIFKMKRVKAFFCWYSLDSNFFHSLTIFLLSFYAFSLLAKQFADKLILDDTVWQLGASFFLLAVLATAIYFIYYFCSSHRNIPFIKKHKRLLKNVCALLFIACGLINIFGYHTLSIHLAFAGISTFAIIFCTLLIEQAVNRLYNLCIQPGPFNTKITLFFGYKPQQTLTEFLILKTTIQLCIFALALYLISQSWGYATYYINSAYIQFLYGIHFASFTFYPTRIIAGIVVFCILYLLFRSISTALSRHEQFEEEEETQVAIASILTYIGFAVALVTALLISGFNFTGLAIVAGALSVGIGLGLQSIVNNFVSGIILLIEKPIKPGDRIRVDSVEGMVKKIRVRSTQITTSAREDIIIPNSDLITRPVINYMYSDKYLSIFCEVRVAYGSDIEQVRDILLQVATNHNEIVTTSRNKPSVLFHSFGESALIFQVWFLIKDGNHKAAIKSDLHFEIDRLFREHNIQFALPQRDIHIKLSDIDSISSTK
ncbi:MAG: mechanosensitive ion channel [Legionellaceae bacterium]|nr:mechanosensitive ion channel [Legionellaceae bacterium]